MKQTKHGENPVFDAVAEQVRGLLPDQQQRIFDEMWTKGPQETSSLLKALSKPWPEMTKGSLHGAVFEMRATFENHFQSPMGIGSEYRLAISKNDRRGKFVLAGQNRLSPSTAFWLGHLRNPRRTGLVLAEQNPLCVLEPGQKIYRDWQLRLGLDPAMPFLSINERPPRAVRLGDVQGMVSIHAFLKRWEEKKLGYLAPEVIGSEEVIIDRADSLVVLGSSRDWDNVIETEWEDFPLSLKDRNLIERFKDYENSMDVIGPETPDWGPPLDCCGVLVSRSTSRIKDRCVTVINGSHPLAVKAVCELITDDDRIESEIVKRLELPDVGFGFPKDFQIFFGVVLNASEDRVVSIRALQFGTLHKRKSDPGFWEGQESKLRSAVNLLSKETALLKHV